MKMVHVQSNPPILNLHSSSRLPHCSSCSSSCRLSDIPSPSLDRSSSSSSRRVFLSTVLTAAPGLGLAAQDAQAGLDKYIKKRKLDPLETYIPGIILCQSQFQELETKLLAEKVEYQDARSLLRSGPAGSLRSNIRAVAEYAAESGDGSSASDAVKLCLRSLEDLDSLLLRASRNDNSITVDSMKTKLGTSLQALDRLLQTVPGPVLEKGKAIAMAFLDDNPLEEESSAEVADIQSFIPSK